MDRRILLEFGILGICGYFLFFAVTNVNPALEIYQGLLVLGIILAFSDIFFGKKSLFMTNPSISWGKAILISSIAYVVLIFASQFAQGLSNAIPLTEILKSLGATAPIFSNSPSINFIIFGIIIPIIESYTIFVVALDIFSSLMKTEPTRRNLFTPKIIFLIIILTIAFIFYHVTSKGVSNEVALMIVGIMAFISLVLVVWFEEGRISILLHIIANSISLIGMGTNG